MHASRKSFAISTAKKAGLYLYKNFKKDPLLTSKRGLAKQIVTKYDLKSDEIIKEEIIKNFPRDNILTEETGFINKNSDYTWIVDPLDGTANYASCNPFFSVSIALAKKRGKEQEIILGVVYAPALQEIYVAEKNKGSFFNGKRIHASGISNISKSYIVACEGGDKTNERITRIYKVLHPRVKDIRKLGSAAIEGCFVAAGRAEAYLTLSIYLWDIAAAFLILEEAGGKITKLNGKPWDLKKSDIIMSNSLVHEKIIGLISYVGRD